jgi:hypothetical protein
MPKLLNEERCLWLSTDPTAMHFSDEAGKSNIVAEKEFPVAAT